MRRWPRGPVPKPDGFRGDARADVFELAWPLTTVRAVRLAVDAAAAQGTGEARALAGFREAWLEYEQHLEGNEMTATAVVMAMIEGWNQRDMDRIVECFAEDAVYHNIPMEPVHCKAAIREGLTPFLGRRRSDLGGSPLRRAQRRGHERAHRPVPDG